MLLTRNEIEIMEVLWAAKEPISSKDIIQMSKNKSWKDSSIHILLNSLLKKKAIREVGFIRTGRTYGRTFEPTESGERYYADYLAGVAQKTSIPILFSALCSSNNISHDTIRELQEMLDKKKKELEQHGN